MIKTLFFFIFVSNVMTICHSERTNQDTHNLCTFHCPEELDCTNVTKRPCFNDRNDLARNMDIPGLGVQQLVEDDNISFSWKVPQDGSHNYLTGFDVNVHFFYSSGVEQDHCYKIDFGSNWTSKVKKKEGITVLMDCNEVTNHFYTKIIVIVSSLPMNKENPKDMRFEKKINKKFDWEPVLHMKIKEKALHLSLKNPLIEIKKYFFQIICEKNNEQHIVSEITFKVEESTPDISERKSGKEFIIPFNNSVYEWDGNNKFVLILQVFDRNNNFLPHRKDYVIPIQNDDLKVVRSIDDNRLIIIAVTLSIAIAACVFICFLWRRKILVKVRTWIYGLSSRNSTNKLKLPKIFTIYCFESQNYVQAVECHISLLRKFADVTQFPLEVYFSTNAMALPELKYSSIIIYLSPKLGELLNKGSDISDLCQLDVLCAHSVHFVHELLLKDKASRPYIVTFDCFEHKELDILPDLQDVLVLHNQSEVQLMPLKLATCISGNWMLENTDQLLDNIYKSAKISLDFSSIVPTWEDCQEAHGIVKYLSLLTHSQLEASNPVETDLAPDNKTESSLNNSIVHLSNGNPKLCSMNTVFLDDLTVCDEQSTDDNVHVECYVTDYKKQAPHVPLISHSSGYHSGSIESYSEDPEHSIKLSVRYNNENSEPKITLLADSWPCNPRPALLDKRHIYYDSANCGIFVDEIPVPTSNSESHCKIINSELPTYHQRINSVYQKTSHELRNHPVSTDGLNKFDSDWMVHNEQGFHRKIIPPNLCVSNSASIDSVCEKINRVNENSNWSNVNLAQ